MQNFLSLTAHFTVRDSAVAFYNKALLKVSGEPTAMYSQAITYVAMDSITTEEYNLSLKTTEE